jgi:hypothetical protein
VKHSFEKYLEKTGWIWFLIILVFSLIAVFAISERRYQTGLSITDFSLKTILCGEEQWYDNIPIFNFFTCNGRLGAVAGVVGAVLLVLLIVGIPMIAALFTAVPLLWLIPVILGYLVGTAASGIVLDYWYLFLAGIILSSILAAKKKEAEKDGKN